MATFINIDFDKKMPTSFFWKHLLFSSLWLLGIFLLIFRADLVIIKSFGDNARWLLLLIPTLYIVIFIAILIRLKWGYKIVLATYPILMFFWFIPKTILRVGKIYLLERYIASIYSMFKNYKLSFIHGVIFIITFILFLTLDLTWVKWVSIAIASYFFLLYTIRIIRNAFNPPSLFGESIVREIEEALVVKSPEKSLVVSTFVINKEEKELDIAERNEKQVRRTILASYFIDLLRERLSGGRGRKAYIISWLASAVVFFISSVCFFWFLNFQLFSIDNSNFLYSEHYPIFDFLYYTLKTITFTNIELVQPISILARSSEILSFFTIGIFVLIILFSIIFTVIQDRAEENLKLTMALFNHENASLEKYMKNEFGMEIESAMKDVADIETALRNLKKFIDRVF